MPGTVGYMDVTITNAKSAPKNRRESSWEPVSWANRAIGGIHYHENDC